jgi:putative ABC transport system ATP-binding protein
MSDAAPAICVSELWKTFDEGRITALRGASLDVAEREFVAVTGPSGCGKSTLLHLIAALDRPDSGSIRVADHDLAHTRDLSHYRARHVGMVFQLHNLLPTLTASENVQVPMFELGRSASERRRRADELLTLVGLADRVGSRPAELSGGERQRVALARALANDPPILLADEPTGNLDSQAGRLVLDLLGRLRVERGLTIVLVTHDPAVAARADRIVYMLDGRLATEAEAAVRFAPASVAVQGPAAGAPTSTSTSTKPSGASPATALGSRAARKGAR